MKNYKYLIVYVAIAILISLSFAKPTNNEFQFKKVRAVMPERTNTELTIRDDVFFTFLPQYIGLKPDQLFDFDVSQLKLEKDTVYNCYFVIFMLDTNRQSWRFNYHVKVGGEFDFTTVNVHDGLLQLPINFCTRDSYMLPEKPFFIDIMIQNKSENNKVFSRIALRPYLNGKK